MTYTEIASTWTFARDEKRIVVRCPAHTYLVISGDGPATRHVNFSEIAPRPGRLPASEFECRLLSEGWSLLAFTPG